MNKGKNVLLVDAITVVQEYFPGDLVVIETEIGRRSWDVDLRYSVAQVIKVEYEFSGKGYETELRKEPVALKTSIKYHVLDDMGKTPAYHDYQIVCSIEDYTGRELPYVKRIP